MLGAACPSPPPPAQGSPSSSYLCTVHIEVTPCLSPTDLHLSGKLHDYVVTVPCSTDVQGRFLSHVVSAPAAASSQSHLRVARSPLNLESESLRRRFLYFNVTVFGKLLHLSLQPNRRLVAPGAPVEWQEDFQELFRQPLQQECVYTGSVTGMAGAAVAISNCDGLVRDKTFTPVEFQVPSPALSTSHRFGIPKTWHTRCQHALAGCWALPGMGWPQWDSTFLMLFFSRNPPTSYLLGPLGPDFQDGESHVLG